MSTRKQESKQKRQEQGPNSGTDHDRGGEASRLATSLRAISGKWKIQIMSHLMNGSKRFSELRRLLRGIGRGMLSYELRQLQSDGLIHRTQYKTIPPTVEYFLTERGHGLEPVLTALVRWADTDWARD